MKTTRRQFLTTASTTAIGAGILIGAAACSSEDDTTTNGSGGGGSAGGCGAEGADIAGNHGHSLSVPQADVDAATEKTYSIQGDSPHDHEVTVTAADFMALATGGAVTITATSDGTHDHAVTISCA